MARGFQDYKLRELFMIGVYQQKPEFEWLLPSLNVY